MRVFQKVLATASVALCFGAQAGQLIDDFSTSQTLMHDLTTGDGGLSSQTLLSANIIGGYRDIFVEKYGVLGDDGFTGVSLGVNGAAPGKLAFASDPGQNGIGIVRWDGSHFDSFATIDATGLGGINLALDGNAFHLKVLSADLNFPFTMTAYTDGSNFSSLTVTSTGPGDYYIPFAAFAGGAVTGTGVNFSNVGALQAIINTGGLVKDVDVQLDIVSTVPEPMSLALVGVGLLGLGAVSRRRSAKEGQPV
jgi:hypothetical protein